MTTPTLPDATDLLWPTLKALKKSGGSASIQDLFDSVTGHLALPDNVLEIPHNDGPQTEVGHRLAWARTHLKWAEAINNTERGLWTITPIGRGISSEQEVRDRVHQARIRRKERRRRHRNPSPTGDRSRDYGPSPASDWETPLLAILRGLTPDAFERLCQRILRESGFSRVEITGRSGDGGIDGSGVLRVNLISFHVRFQCKRYAGAVGVGEIRDFKGAMVGRADKGLFLTTGRFTRDAAREAVRDGAPAIDLIDGSELCTLLSQLQLGVSTESIVRLQPDFFDDL